MISFALSPQDFLFAFLTVAVFEVLFFIFLLDRYFKMKDLLLISKRLIGYSYLAGNTSSFDCDSQILKPGPHSILLGTLKKIEQKNSNVSVFIIFAFAVIFTVISSAPIELSPMKGFSVILMIGLMLPLLSALIGFRQLDNFNLDLTLAPTDKLLMHQLQQKLMQDLLLKEICFRFSFHSTQLLITLYLLISFSILINCGEYFMIKNLSCGPTP